MSIAVALEDLAATVATRGPLAYLVTVGERGPRVVSVSVSVASASASASAAATATEDDVDPGAGPGTGGAGVQLVVEVGRHTVANVAARPAVTVLWPADAADPTHSLLVDGTASATEDGEHLHIAPSRAILHRVRVGRGAPPPAG